MSKSEFVRSLQSEKIALSPYDVSQRLRLAHGCVSVWKGDKGLEIQEIRGYMLRLSGNHKGTPENPELYQCVISLNQPKPWQDLVWTKEIIHILDHVEHRTKDKDALGHMLDNRETFLSKRQQLPANVTADTDGLTLALGCVIPMSYRQVLRQEKYLERYELVDLEKLFSVPADFIPSLLDPAFEAVFEAAILQCDKE